nr:hypothetical protein GCM10020092_068720 [Actinoplanes digitatis]
MAAAGMVVTEISTPTSVPVLAEVSESIAGHAAEEADHPGQRVRAPDEVGERPLLEQHRPVHQIEGGEQPHRQHRDDHGEREAGREGQPRAADQPPSAPHDADAEGGERAELRADDHRSDDQDRLVEQDTDRGDDHGDGHERQERAGQLGLLAGLLLELLPDHGVDAQPGYPPCGPVGRRRQRGVDPLDDDRAVGVQPAGAQPVQHDAGTLADHVELQHVAARRAGGAGQHDQVGDRHVARQLFQYRLGAFLGCDHPYMQHPGP